LHFWAEVTPAAGAGPGRLVLGSNVYAVRPSSFEHRPAGTPRTLERLQARSLRRRRKPWAIRSRLDGTGATGRRRTRRPPGDIEALRPRWRSQRRAPSRLGEARSPRHPYGGWRAPSALRLVADRWARSGATAARRTAEDGRTDPFRRGQGAAWSTRTTREGRAAAVGARAVDRRGSDAVGCT